MPIAAFLVAMAWPIAKKVLVMLGIGVITYGGLQLIGQQVQSAIISSYGQLGSSVLGVFGLAGIPESIGILLGAINARIAFVAVGKIGKVASQ